MQHGPIADSLPRGWIRSIEQGLYFFLDQRINVRHASTLPVAEVVRRWRFVLRVFYAKVLSKTADRLISRVSLRDRSRQAGPINGCCHADVGLISIGREGRKTAQKIFCVAEREADGTPHGKIGFDSRNHTFTSGHGWAICLSSATSALA